MPINLPDQTRLTIAIADGVDPQFDFDFYIAQESDLQVQRNGTIQTRGTHYLVDPGSTGNVSGGGITFQNSYEPDADDIITMKGETVLERDAVFGTGVQITSAGYEADATRFMGILQEFKRDIDRTPRLPDTLAYSGSLILPSPTDGYILGWSGDDENGTIINIATLADVATVAASIDTITAAANNVPKNNTTATADPTVNDDEGDGYGILSRWVNTSTGDVFTCTDPAAGAAVWESVTDVTSDKMSGTANRLFGTNGSGAGAEVTVSNLTLSGGVLSAYPSLPNGGYASNLYYLGGTMYDGSGSALSANNLFAIPFHVGATETFTRIGINVTSSHASSARLGIYRVANGVPSTLVLDAGTVSVSSTGQKEITISATLTPGVYALALVSNGTASITLGIIEEVAAGHVVGKDSLTNSNGGWVRSFTYGALPDPFGSVGGYQTAPYLLWLRKV